MHARWCQRGSRKGALRESHAARAVREREPNENRTRYIADVPGCRDIYPREALWARRSKPPPLPPRSPDLSVDSAPSSDPFLSKHCPSFTNPAARRGHQIPCLFWTLSFFYYLCWIKASSRPDATPTVSVVCFCCHTLSICLSVCLSLSLSLSRSLSLSIWSPADFVRLPTDKEIISI